MSARLAIDGGTPVIADSIPSGMHGPSVIDAREINAVTEVLRSGKLFRFVEDSNVASFEKEAAAYLGTKHALMVNSGTSAIICALTGLGVGPGDEVIVPGYTFIATAAAIVGVGAIPVIAEIDDSLGLDIADVERKITPHTKAILPVHMQGSRADLRRLSNSRRSTTSLLLRIAVSVSADSIKGNTLERGDTQVRGALTTTKSSLAVKVGSSLAMTTTPMSAQPSQRNRVYRCG